MLDDKAKGQRTDKPRRTNPPAHTGLLTLTEASAVLGVSKITLRRWTKSGAIRCVRIGRRKDRRFRPADIEEFIVAHLGEPVAAKAPTAAGEAEGAGVTERSLPSP